MVNQINALRDENEELRKRLNAMYELREQYHLDQKKLKALEFLKNNLDIEFEIKENRCFIELHFDRFYARQELPKQEYDLLKEVLK